MRRLRLNKRPNDAKSAVGRRRALTFSRACAICIEGGEGPRPPRAALTPATARCEAGTPDLARA